MSAKVGVWAGVLLTIAIVVTVAMVTARPVRLGNPNFAGIQADLPAAGYGHLPPSPLLKPGAAETRAQRIQQYGRHHRKHVGYRTGRFGHMVARYSRGTLRMP